MHTDRITIGKNPALTIFVIQAVAERRAKAQLWQNRINRIRRFLKLSPSIT